MFPQNFHKTYHGTHTLFLLLTILVLYMTTIIIISYTLLLLIILITCQMIQTPKMRMTIITYLRHY